MTLKQYYSVPHEYIKQKVDARITRNVIEIFYGGNRIASHVRLYGHDGQYSTVVEHMPPNHQKYLEWNGAAFGNGLPESERPPKRLSVVFFPHTRWSSKAIRSCMGLLKLADKYSGSRLEAACKRALSYTPNPGYKSIGSILQTGSDRLEQEKQPDSSSEYGFTRGASYYGRNGK